jgi:hypothetical protein
MPALGWFRRLLLHFSRQREWHAIVATIAILRAGVMPGYPGRVLDASEPAQPDQVCRSDKADFQDFRFAGDYTLTL